MRLLHTSDWHVGRSLHGTDLLAEQEAVLAHMVEVVRTERVDVVVVAGDVYDRAVPSADATGVLDRALTRFRAAGAVVVLTPGNHDSARRLGFASELLASSGVHVRAAFAALDEPVLLADDHGEVAVYGLPFLEPEVARHALGPGVGRSHQAVLAAAMDRVRSDLHFRPGARSVVLAHAFVGGGEPSESERDIAVGGVDLVSPSVFDGVDYVALGHLHRPQSLTHRLRYSGSPMAYSFGEAGQQKSAWLVDLGPAGLEAVEPVLLPAPRQLSVVTGRLLDLLADPALASVEDHLLSVRLVDEVRPEDPMRRLQSRFRHCVHLEWSGSSGSADTRSYTDRVRGRTDLEVAGDFVDHVRGVGPSVSERELLGRALTASDRVEVAR